MKTVDNDTYIKNKILEIIPDIKDRYKLFKKVYTLSILIHYEEVQKQNDETINYLGSIRTELLPNLDGYMRYNRITKTDAKVLDILKQSSISKLLQDTEIHFVLFISYLSWYGVQKRFYKKPLIRNPIKVKLVHTKVQAYIESRENEELEQLAKITLSTAKMFLEKHKYYFSLTDRNLRGE